MKPFWKWIHHRSSSSSTSRTGAVELLREREQHAHDQHEHRAEQRGDELVLGSALGEDADRQRRRAEQEHAEVADEDLRERDLAVHLDEQRHVDRQHEA